HAPTSARSCRSARFEERLPSLQERFEVLAGRLVRREEIHVTPVGRELLLQLGDARFGALDLTLDELERGRLHLGGTLRLLGLDLRRWRRGRDVRFLRARVVGPAPGVR